MLRVNSIHQGDCLELLDKVDNNSIDLIFLDPPYNLQLNKELTRPNHSVVKGVNQDWDKFDDFKSYDEFTYSYLNNCKRILKDDGRVAINVPIETNVQERGGRILFNAEFWMRMKEVGFQFFGMVDLIEDSPHRVRQTAWGSWMSASSPYIYITQKSVSF